MRKKLLLLISSFLLLFQLTNAQDFEWAKSAGGTGADYGEAVATDSNGNVYITGRFQGTATFGSTTLTSAGDYDVFIAKYDSNGNFEWAKRAGGTGVDEGRGIAIDSNGNVYITGRFQGTATFGGTTLTSAGIYDIFISKLDSSGNFEWTKQTGGTSNGRGYGIATDSHGNVYITGHFYGTATFGSTTLTSVGSSDIFISKLDSSGNFQWTKQAGGTSNDNGYGIATDFHGNVYITGYFGGTAAFGSTTLTSVGNSDIFISKLDSSGNFQWAKSAGGLAYDYVYDIATDSHENVYITGFFSGTASFGSTTLTGAGNYDIFISKLDSSGNFEWVKSAGGTSADYGLGIATDSQGDIYATGSFNSTAGFDGTSLTSAGNIDIFITKLSEYKPVEVYESDGVTFVSGHSTIQEGINAAQPGYIVKVDEGTYEETINLNKNITLRGPNYDKHGTDTSRVPEAILKDKLITVSAGVFEGFRVVWASGTGTVAMNVSNGVLTIRNNIFYRENTGTNNVAAMQVNAGANARTIEGNYFLSQATSGARRWRNSMWLNANATTVVNVINNRFERLNTGINFEGFGPGVYVDGNEFVASTSTSSHITFGAPPAGTYTFGKNYFNTGNSITIGNCSGCPTGFRLDLTQSVIDNTDVADATITQLFDLERGLNHLGRSVSGVRNGFFMFKENSLFVRNSTIQNGITHAQPGDTIFVYNKTWTESVVVDKDNLTFYGRKYDIPVISRSSSSGESYMRPSSQTNPAFSTTGNVDKLTIKGFYFEGSQTSSNTKVGIVPQGTVDDFIIENNVFNAFNTSAKESFKAYEGSGNVIFRENKYINSTMGPFFDNGVSGEIHNNIIPGVAGGTAIRLGGSENDVQIYHNDLSGTGTGITVLNDGGADDLGNTSVYENNLSGRTTYFDNQRSAALDNSCNWFGETDKGDINAKVSGNAPVSTYLTTDTNDGSLGFVPTGTCSYPINNPIQGTGYLTLQDAIDDANNGEEIIIDEGTYETCDLLIDKSVIITGANAANNPNTEARAAESVLQGTTAPGELSCKIEIDAENVIIRGFTFDNLRFDNYNGQAGSNTDLIDGIEIENNIFTNVVGTAIYLRDGRNAPGQYSSGLKINNNKITSPAGVTSGVVDYNAGTGILLMGAENSSISGNIITDANYNGIQLARCKDMTISNNIATDAKQPALQIAQWNGGINNVTDNTFSTTSASRAAIRLYGFTHGYNPVFNITENTVKDSKFGIQIGHGGTGQANDISTADYDFSDNTFTSISDHNLIIYINPDATPAEKSEMDDLFEQVYGAGYFARAITSADPFTYVFGSSKIYVNDGSTVNDVYTTAVGDDTNGLGTPWSPYATIGKAISVAGDGDEIYVDTGTYTESDITIDAEVRIIGAGQDKTIISPDPMKADDGTCSTADPLAGNPHHGLLIKADNVTIKDLAVDGGAGKGYRFGISTLYWPNGHYDNTTIEDVTVTNVNYRGIVLRRNSGITTGHIVSNVTVTNGGCGEQSYGILGFNVDDMTIDNCIVDGWYNGIATGNYTGINTKSVITNNSVTDATQYAYTLTHTGISPTYGASTFENNAADFTDDSNQGVGLFTYLSELEVKNNTFEGAFRGVKIGRQSVDKSKLIIGKNEITGWDKEIVGSAGIYAVDDNYPGLSHNFTVSGTEISGYQFGVLVSPINGMEADVAVFGAEIDDVEIGIYAYDSPSASTHGHVDVSVDQSIITGAEQGITLDEAVGGSLSGVLTDNLIEADWAGINIYNGMELSATNPLTIEGNDITMTDQIAPNALPTGGIVLRNISGTAAATVKNNNIDGAFGGIGVYGMTTNPVTEIEGGTITGVMQGLVIVNLDPVDMSGLAPSEVKIKDVTVKDFAGNHGGPYEDANFHAGVYATSSGSDPSATVTVTADNLDISGTGNHSQSSAAYIVADWSGIPGILNVIINESNIHDNKNRGIHVRGEGANVTVTGSTFINNGNDPYGAGHNEGYAIAVREGAELTALKNYITNPAAVAGGYDVYALFTDGAGAGTATLTANYNWLSNNGNPNGKLAYNLGDNGVWDVDCNWWGTTSIDDIEDMLIGDIEFIPYLADDDIDNPDCSGGPISVWDQADTFVAAYATIQAAIDDDSTLNGYRVEVSEGIYEERIEVNKSLTINGPNSGISPNTGARVPEAILQFPSGFTSGSGEESMIFITADNVTVSGFTLDGQNYHPAGADQSWGISSEADNSIITNNKVLNFATGNVYVTSWKWTGSWTTEYRNGAEVRDNYIASTNLLTTANDDSFLYGIYLQGTYGEVTDNVVKDVRTAIQVQPYQHPNTSGAIGLVTDNDFEAYGEVIWYNAGGMGVSDAATNWKFSKNHLTGIARPAGVSATEWKGFRVFGYQAGTVVFNENSVLEGSSDAATKWFITNSEGSPSKVLDAECNWYGLTDLAQIDAGVSGDVNFSPYLISDDLDNPECLGGPVTVWRNAILISAHATIQSGVDASQSGDEVRVSEGTYNEAVTIGAGLDGLELNGAVDGSGNPTSIINPGSLGAGISANDSENLVIRNFEITGSTGRGIIVKNTDGVLLDNLNVHHNASDGIRVDKATDATVQNSISDNNKVGLIFYALGEVKNNVVSNAKYRGMYIVPGAGGGYNSGDVLVSGNEVFGNWTDHTFTEWRVGGIIYYDDGKKFNGNVTIESNTVYDNYGPGINVYKLNESETTGLTLKVSANTVYENKDALGRGAGDGIVLYLSNYIDVEDNTVYGNENAGIRISNDYHYNSYFPTSNNTLTGNIIHDNERGIYIQGNNTHKISGIVINENSIYDNTVAGLEVSNNGAEDIDAKCNWWGQSTGPDAGDILITNGSTGTVSSAPFITDGTDNSGAPGFQPVPGTCSCPDGTVTNQDTLHIYCSIQEAIDSPDTLDGHTLSVSEGTYTENIVVSKEVTLNGAQSGTDARGRSGNESVINGSIKVQADNVTIDGFTINKSGSYQEAITLKGTGGVHHSYSTVQNNIFNLSGWAVGIKANSNYTLITQNVFNNNQGHTGIEYSNNPFHDISIIDNEFTGGSIASTDINFIGAPSFERPLVSNENIVIKGNATSTTSGNFVVSAFVDNLEITDNVVSSAKSGTQIALIGGNRNVTVENNELHGKGTGVYLYQHVASDHPTWPSWPANEDVHVNYNSILSNTTAIRFTAGALDEPFLDAKCNWYGTDDFVTIKGKIMGDINFVPYLVTDDLDNPDCSGGPVTVWDEADAFVYAYATIQEAIDDATTLDGQDYTVLVSEGIYPENVTMTKSVNLKSENGPADTKIHPSSGRAINFPANKNISDITVEGFTLQSDGSGVVLIQMNSDGSGNHRTEDVTFKDLVLEGDGVNFGFGMFNSKGSKVEDVIINEPFVGFEILGAKDLHLDNVDISNSDSYAFNMWNTAGGYMPNENILIENSSFTDSSTDAIYVRGVDGMTLDNVIVKSNNGIGFKVAPGDATAPQRFNEGITVKNSTFEDNISGSDVRGYTGDFFLQDNDYVHNTGGGGKGGALFFAPQGQVDVYATGNLFEDNNVGFFLDGGPSDFGGEIKSNDFIANRYAGVSITDFNNLIEVKNNKFVDNPIGVEVKDENAQIEENSFESSDPTHYAIRTFTTDLAYPASCNWWGTAVKSEIADKITGTGEVDYTLFLLSGGNAAAIGERGFIPTGVCWGPVEVLDGSNDHIAYYGSIQAAIDDVTTLDGYTVKAEPGEYHEEVYVYKSVTILGANAGVPGNGARGPESIVYPDANHAAGFWVVADDVTIDGFHIDGDSPLITDGSPIINTLTDSNAAYGILVYGAPVSNFVAKNNIVENSTYTGIMVYGESSTPTSGNVITDNLIRNLGTDDLTNPYEGFGVGVLIYNEAYTAVTDNVIENVKVGVQTGNYHRANPNAVNPEDDQIISGNDITTWGIGIWYNLHNAAASPYTIEDNTINAMSKDTGDARDNWFGIFLSSLDLEDSLLKNNDISGAGNNATGDNVAGYQVWNVSALANPVIEGGTVSDVNFGIYANNYEGYKSNGPSGGTATVKNITFEDISIAGIKAKDNVESTTHASVKINIGEDIVIKNSENGVIVENENASVSAYAENLSFENINDEYWHLINNDKDIDATGTIYDGVPVSAMSQNDIDVNIDSKITDKLDDSNLGLVILYYNVRNNDTGDLYLTIQEAVDAAVAGQELEIIVSELVEPTQVTVDKSLTIIGSGMNNTTVKAGVNTGSAGDARGYFFVEAGNEVTFKDFTFDGSGKNIYQAVRYMGSGEVSGMKFTEVKYPGYQGTAIAAMGDGNVNVTDSKFDNIGRIGVIYFGAGISSSVFESNEFIGLGAGDNINYGVEVAAGAKVNIRFNEISNNTGVASGVYTSAGILVSTYSGAGTEAVIENNKLNDNYVGVSVGYDANDQSQVIIDENDMSGNDFAVINLGADPVELGCNWYGVTATGDIYDMLYGDVIFSSYLENGINNAVGLGFDPDADCIELPIWNEDSGYYYASIQEAVDAVETLDTHTIVVLPADFTEPAQVTIDKSVTVRGAGMDDTTVRPGVNTGAYQPYFLVDNGMNVTFKDFTFDGGGKNIYQVVRYMGSGEVNGVRFTGVKYPGAQGNAVSAEGSGNVDILDSKFDNIGKVGVIYSGTGITGSTFSGNTFRGLGAGAIINYAVDINSGASVTVSWNDISNCLGVSPSGNILSSGILVSTSYPPGTEVIIENNKITHNAVAINISMSATAELSQVTIDQNDLSDNQWTILYFDAPQTLVTGCNWYGTDNMGDIESGTTGNVLIDSFLENGDSNPVAIGFDPVSNCIEYSLFSTRGILSKELDMNSAFGWPEEVPNGYLVLDAANMGLVLSHVKNPDMDITDPVPGMMVYDTTEKCVKLYRGTTPGADTGRAGWHCIKESNYDGSDID